MGEYITLMGSEDVSSAGRRISAAADTMSSAAGTISDALFRFGQIADRTAEAATQLAESIDRYIAFEESRMVTVTSNRPPGEIDIPQHPQPCGCGHCLSLREG